MDRNGAIRVVAKHVGRKARRARRAAFMLAMESVTVHQDFKAFDDYNDRLLRQTLYTDLTFSRLCFPYEAEIAYHPTHKIMEAMQKALRVSREEVVFEKFIGKGHVGRIVEATVVETQRKVVVKLVCLRSYGQTERAVDDTLHERYELGHFLTETFLQRKVQEVLPEGMGTPEVVTGDTEVVRMQNEAGRTVWMYGIMRMGKVDGVLSHLMKARYNEMMKTKDTPRHAEEMIGYKRFLIHVATEMKDLLGKLRERNVVHGDFHPGNIAYSITGRCTLLDFERTVFDLSGSQGIVCEDHRRIMDLDVDAFIMWRWSALSGHDVAKDLNAALHMVGFPKSRLLSDHVKGNTSGTLDFEHDSEVIGQTIFQVDEVYASVFPLFDRSHRQMMLGKHGPSDILSQVKFRVVSQAEHVTGMNGLLGSYLPLPPLVARHYIQASIKEDMVVVGHSSVSSTVYDRVIENVMMFGTTFPYMLCPVLILPIVLEDGSIDHVELTVEETLSLVSQMRRGENLEYEVVASYIHILLANTYRTTPKLSLALWTPAFSRSGPTSPCAFAYTQYMATLASIADRDDDCTGGAVCASSFRLHAFPVCCDRTGAWSLFLLDSLTGLWYVFEPVATWTDKKALASALTLKLGISNPAKVATINAKEMPVRCKTEDSGVWLCVFITMLCRGGRRLPPEIATNVAECFKLVDEARRSVIHTFLSFTHQPPSQLQQTVVVPNVVQCGIERPALSFWQSADIV